MLNSWRTLFDSALIKLTSIYTLILLFVSVVFSISFYQVSVRELNTSNLQQAQVLQRVLRFDTVDDRDDFFAAQYDELENSKKRVGDRLVLANIFVLFGSLLLSYFLARKSLEPIKAAHEAQTRFTADASHELRTPITAMMSEIQVALRDPKLKKAESIELLESNLEELGKLSSLSDALLRLSRGRESGEIQNSKLLVDGVIQEACSRVEKRLVEKNIKIEKPKSSTLTIFGDKDMIIELIYILLDNAVKYSPEKSTITIRAKKCRNNNTQIYVADNGPGIPMELKDKVFERFYRVDESRSKTKGYGLGLSIAKHIAILHGGSICLDERKKKGTCFVVTLPRC